MITTSSISDVDFSDSFAEKLGCFSGMNEIENWYTCVCQIVNDYEFV